MIRALASAAGLVLAATASSACASNGHRPDSPAPLPREARKAEPGIAGPVWQLVTIRYSDDTTVVPDDPGRYSLQFQADGRLLVRADCNRGTGAWKAEGPSLTLGPIGMTRAMCAPDSLFDRYTQALDGVVSYLVRDGKLHLAIKADTGILEFRQAP